MTSTREPNLIRPTRSPGLHEIAHVFGADDAARNQAGDLLEHDLSSVLGADSDDVLLVLAPRPIRGWRPEIAPRL